MGDRLSGSSEKDMNFKRKAGLTVAAGLTALAGLGAAKAIESRGGVSEVVKGIQQEQTEKKIDFVKRMSEAEPIDISVDHRGVSGIYQDAGWSNSGLEVHYYEEALKSIPENTNIDFDNLQKNQNVKAYIKLDSGN